MLLKAFHDFPGIQGTPFLYFEAFQPGFIIQLIIRCTILNPKSLVADTLVYSLGSKSA